MKRQSLSIVLVFATVMALFQNCSKEYFDLNDNPNLVTQPAIALLLTTATHKTGINSYNVGSAVSSYVQYTANPSASASSDIYQEVDLTGTW
ncbi:MAG: SusD/RagB family nutrient-binding outer membrane lipoprotein, partial [Sphingobacteriales bacterium]